MDAERELNNEMNDIVSKSIIKNLLTEEEVDDIPPLYKGAISLSQTSETGVVVQLGDKFWGNDGWVELKRANIHNPFYLKKPEQIARENSPNLESLKKATLVEVIKTTTIDIELKY
jgi:hypothetical protein